MKKRLVDAVMMAVVPAMLLSVSACKTGMGGTDTEDVVAVDGGVMVVDTITLEATVVAKDAESRKITLQSDDTGEKKTFKAPPEMVNFAQVNVGDQVEAVVTEEVAVYIGAGAPPSASADGTVMLSPVGSKPGGVVVASQQVTAVVSKVNVEKRKVTLTLPDGTTKTIKVSKDLDLSDVEVGENVTVVIGEGLAVSVTAP